MRFRKSLIVALSVILVTISSCVAPKTGNLENVTTASPDKDPNSDASKVLISLGDKKLTIQQARWLMPKADNQQLANIANFWLENELLYAEAEKNGITNNPQIKFISELNRKQEFSKEMAVTVQRLVKISDEAALDYYEKNKDTDPLIKREGSLTFSHIRTKTLEEAQVVLQRIKAGEDINYLAVQLSIYELDAKGGGIARDYSYSQVEKHFSPKFLEAMIKATKGQIIGPIESKNNSYEIVRQERKTEPEILPFEKVKDLLKSKLHADERMKALNALLDSLRQAAADKTVKSPMVIQFERPNNRNPEDANVGGKNKQE